MSDSIGSALIVAVLVSNCAFAYSLFRLFKRLRMAHPVKFKQLGSPAVHSLGVMGTIIVMGFIYGGEYKLLHDDTVVRRCDRVRQTFQWLVACGVTLFIHVWFSAVAV